MNHYLRVYEVVTRLTDNPTLRAFFIPYLLAETNAERKTLDTRFWQAMETLDESSRKHLREAMQHSFMQLLPMAKDLSRRVDEALSERTALAA